MMKYVDSQIAKLYGKSSSDFTWIAEVQNIVFAFDFAETQAVLRLTPEQHRSYGQVTAEVDWVLYLANEGVSVAKPLSTLDGQFCSRAEVDGIGYTVTAFEKAAGDIGERSFWSSELFRNWGKAMGMMHVATMKYAPVGIVRADWTAHIPSYCEHIPDEIAAATKIHEIKCRLDNKQFFAHDFGLIHSDFHYWNFAVNPNGIVIFDHDNCEYHSLSADLGTTLFEASTCAYQKLDRDEFVFLFLRDFLSGYRLFRDPTSLLENLHDFVKLREAQIFLILSKRWRGNKLNEFQNRFFLALQDRVVNSKPFFNTSLENL